MKSKRPTLEADAVSWPVRSLGDYEALFADAAECQICGDVSPSYLAFAEQSVRGIHLDAPRAKSIAILRQPAERTYSCHIGLVCSGREEELDFQRPLRYEVEGRLPRFDGRQRRGFCESFYFDSLQLYFKHFSPEQIRIYLYDDLQQNATGMMQDIFRFIGVDDGFTPDISIRHNQAA